MTLTPRSVAGWPPAALWIPLFVLALFSASAHAAPVSYTVQQQTNPQLDLSFIHSAEGQSVVDPLYYSVGEQYFQVDGVITGDYTAGVLTLDPSVLTLTITSVFIPAGSWEFEILGGTIADAGGGLADGFLDYRLTRNGLEEDAGTFFFDPLIFGGGPNVISETELILWGNNWAANPAFHSSTETRAGFLAGGGTPLGLDLLAVPEPAAWPALALLLGVLRARRPERRAIA